MSSGDKSSCVFSSGSHGERFWRAVGLFRTSRHPTPRKGCSAWLPRVYGSCNGQPQYHFPSTSICLQAFVRFLRISAALATLLGALVSSGEASFALLHSPATQSSKENLNRAESLISEGKLDEAIALLDEQAQKDSKFPGLEAQLGKAYYTKRNFQQAVTHLKRAVEQQPENGESAQLLGLSYYSLGQWGKAIPLLERVQSRVPQTEIDGPYLLGICYLRTQQLEKARAALARMFSVPPAGAMAYLMLAKMMVHMRSEEQAVPELQKAITLDPRLPMAHFLLGEIYLFKSNPQLALEEFKKELEVNPSVWLVYWRLGDAYARLEKYDEAVKALKQSIWLNETFTGPYVLLGEIGLKKGDLELAVGFLERALKLDPNNYYAHYFLGRAYQQLGRNEEARREIEQTESLRMEKKRADQELLLPEKPQ
jgi:tetratricopeptide (TPR) repeat protein